MTTPARFILDAAVAAGIRVGTDGDELLLAPPRGMSHESWFSFERAIIRHRVEIIKIIMRENSR